MLHPSRAAHHARRNSRNLLAHAVIAGLLSVPVVASAQSYTETGKAGDAASWETGEFKLDWGLSAINAQHAYARGLTGRGQRVGVLDSGTALAHGEFADKGTSLHLASMVGGAPCTTAWAGCIVTDGSQAQVYYTDYPQAQRDWVTEQVAAGGLRFNGVDDPLAYLDSLARGTYQTHGTHVAGTIAANREGYGMHGVAFGSDLVVATLGADAYVDIFGRLLALGLKEDDLPTKPISYFQGVADKQHSAVFSDALAQLQAQGVRVVNNSWVLSGTATGTAAGQDQAYKDENLQARVPAYAASKMIQVFAAGNDNGAMANVNARLPVYNRELEPYWLSVANVGIDGKLDKTSSICADSAQWCVSAPGTDIVSTFVGGTPDVTVSQDDEGRANGMTVDRSKAEYGYSYMTGTSMAAPHVSGALALLMERFPYLDNPQIRDVLLTTATDLGAPGVDEIYGWGLIDLKKAIEGPGLLRVDTDVAMNQAAGGIKVWDGPAWDDWTNDISGPGRLTKSGEGWLRLSGANTFAGATVAGGTLELDGVNQLSRDVLVDGGQLVLNGALMDSDLTVRTGLARVRGVATGKTVVASNGLLTGDGTVGNTVVAGTIAPGGGYTTMSVNGDYFQLAGSALEVGIAPDGRNDALKVSGTAELEGGTVQVERAAGTYLLGQQYRILSAEGGVSGRFAGVDNAAISPFLSLGLLYGARDVNLAVGRGRSFVTAAYTPNQLSVALALDAAANNQGLPVVMTQLSPLQATAAFDQLSGEIHATARSVLAESSSGVRNSTVQRARHGQDGFTSQADDDRRVGAWVEVQNDGGHFAANGNSARTDYNGNVVLVGADWQFGADNNWLLGALLGGGRSDANARDRASHVDFKSGYAGLYGGYQIGGLGLRAGWVAGRHDLDTRRDIRIPGYVDTPRASYTAKTNQPFIEAGYGFGVSRWEIEPYLQWAQAQTQADGFKESGGAAALTGQSQKQTVNLYTGGVRFNANLSPSANQTWLSLRGGIGYRHATGDLLSSANVAWSNANSFTVWGAPIAENATVVDLGLGARLSTNSLLELGYTGQSSKDAYDQGLNARFSVQF